MPTLFYAGSAIAFAAGESGALLVALGWAYVALRFAHSFVHVTSNRVMWRFRVFFASWVVLFAYWALIGFALAATGARSGESLFVPVG